MHKDAKDILTVRESCDNTESSFQDMDEFILYFIKKFR